MLRLRLKRVHAEYLEEERVATESVRKKKRKTNGDDTAGDGAAATQEAAGGTFDAAAFDKEYAALLEEMSVSVHPDTLRIDLHPVYVNFVRLNEKGHAAEDELEEVSISRYATLPELYMLLCASCGYLVEDIEAEKSRYRAYLEFKTAAKAAERQSASKKSKNDKVGTLSKRKREENKVTALPPRLWTVVRTQRGHPEVDRLLYPIPKPVESGKAKDGDDGKSAKIKGASPGTADVAANGDGDGDGDTEGDTATTGSADAEETVDEDMDLQSLGLLSGEVIAVEFARTLKKGGRAQYVRLSAEEEAVCQPEVDDSWTEWKVGAFVDGRDKWGKWYEARIVVHKPAGAAMPEKARNLKKEQKERMEELQPLEALFIHYTQWPEKWDEWIFIDPASTLCRCRTRCLFDKAQHRLAPPKTQTKLKATRRASQAASGGAGRRGSSRYSGRSGGDYYGRGRESVRGPPTTAGCVGLVNLGNTCFMNSIIQCVSNTPHFRTFFTSGQYRADINKSNPLGMRGELAREFAKLVTDVWSGDYKVIAPRSLKRALSKVLSPHISSLFEGAMVCRCLIFSAQTRKLSCSLFY